MNKKMNFSVNFFFQCIMHSVQKYFVQIIIYLFIFIYLYTKFIQDQKLGNKYILTKFLLSKGSCPKR